MCMLCIVIINSILFDLFCVWISSGSTQGTTSDVHNVVQNPIWRSKYENLDLVGFMTIAPIAEDPEEVRPYFRKLREIRDKVSNRLNKRLFLSMGMTQDFEVAVEEGADFLRIGRAIFGG